MGIKFIDFYIENFIYKSFNEFNDRLFILRYFVNFCDYSYVVFYMLVMVD